MRPNLFIRQLETRTFYSLMYTYVVMDKISANVKGWAKFESKQIQERLWDYKGFQVRRK